MATAVSLAVVAVPVAIAGAACMGLASAAQAKATKQVPDQRDAGPEAADPTWCAGRSG